MLRIPLLIIVFFLFSLFTHASEIASWDLYTSTPKPHSYTLRYPPDWQIKESGTYQITLTPKDADDQPAVTLQILQFSLPNAINYFQDQYGDPLDIANYLVTTVAEDLISTEINYPDLTIRLFKRGEYLFAFIRQPNTSSDTYHNVVQSLKFNDNWHTYINFKDSYTFIFPKQYDLKTLNEGIQILHQDKIVFSITQTDKVVDPKNTINFNGYAASVLTPNQSIVVRHQNRHYLVTFQSGSLIQQMLQSFQLFDSSYINQHNSSFINFPDVRNSHPNALAINHLTKKRIIQGYPDRTFKPDNTINRAELTKMVVGSKIRPDSEQYKNCFPDVTDQWFAPFICYAKKQNWVSGYPDGTFKPDQEINRVEALKIILESLVNIKIPKATPQNLPKDLDPKAWYAQYFSYAQSQNLLDLQHQIDNQYLPSKPITRKEVAETVYRISNK